MEENQKQKAETLIKTLGTIAHAHEAKRLEVLQAILRELKSMNHKMETLLELKQQLEDRQFLKGTTWGDFER